MNRRNFLCGVAATALVGPKLAEAAPSFSEVNEIVRISEVIADPTHSHSAIWRWKAVLTDDGIWTLKAIDPPQMLLPGHWSIETELRLPKEGLSQ